MPLESLAPQDLALADERWQARVDLAAAHRLAVMHGFHEGIFNHLTLRVPGANDRYYQIPERRRKLSILWRQPSQVCSPRRRERGPQR